MFNLGEEGKESRKERIKIIRPGKIPKFDQKRISAKKKSEKK